METTEQIQTIIEAIRGLDQVTINHWENKNKIITTEEVENYENWETTELKQTLYEQLGKLYYKENGE